MPCWRLRQAGHRVVGERENDVAVGRQQRGGVFVQAALGAAEHEHGRQRPVAGWPVQDAGQAALAYFGPGQSVGNEQPRHLGGCLAGPVGLSQDHEPLRRERVAGRLRVRGAGWAHRPDQAHRVDAGIGRAG